MPLGGGWQTAQVTLPAGALAEGESKILLNFAQSGILGGQKTSAAVEWIQVGGVAPTSDDAPPVVQTESALTLPKDGGLAYYVQVPEGGAFVAVGDAGGCSVHVRASTRDKQLVDAPWTSGTPIEFPSLAGKVVRLELSADGASCTTAKLTSAALTAASAAPAVKYAERPKNVIIWLTDSTRADKFRVYNPKTRVETPVMDAWAKTSTVFKVGYVQGNESRVSHASLWTSLYPATHKFISEKAKLNPDFVTLPEAVKATGRFTAGFMGNGFIDKFWGFGDGWDFLHNHIHDGGGLKAEDLRKAAQGFLGAHGKQPFFLYIGTIDAHVSWRAHEPWISKYDPEPYAGPFVKACLDPQLDNIVAGKLKITERDKVRILALYDSDVSYNDQQFGELLKFLDSNGLSRLDDGDPDRRSRRGVLGARQDRARAVAARGAGARAVRDPLPAVVPGRQEVDEGVELIDVLPTIVDALGGKPPADAQGESLVPLAQGEGAGYPRPAIARQYELAHTMRLSRWKLWVGGSGDTKLIDAANDPMGTKEVSAERPFERRFVTDAIVVDGVSGAVEEGALGRGLEPQAGVRRLISKRLRQPLPADHLVGVGPHERRQPADLGVAATNVKATRALVPVRDQKEQVARARGDVGFDGVEQRAAGAAAFRAGDERDQPQVAAAAERAGREEPGETDRAVPSSSATSTGSPRPIASASSCARRVDEIS